MTIEFTMPEALTGGGSSASRTTRAAQRVPPDKVVTAKDLMVQPNPPRFLREGDVLEFTVKVTNQSPPRQTGTVRLTFADARTGKPADAALGKPTPDQDFDIPAKESRSFSWRLRVPDVRASSPTRRSAPPTSSPTARKASCRCSRAASW